MAKAVYAEHNIGHFGLGFADYAHFTSPIRRYPDLYVHRALKEYAKGQPDRKRWNDLREMASIVGDQCSLTERAAVEAERASVKCAQTILAREHIGSDHVGYVTGVAQFGVFVTLKDLMIEDSFTSAPSMMTTTFGMRSACGCTVARTNASSGTDPLCAYALPRPT
ncbi:MAG: RNB domain-containing ribonuclease [Ignavibacteria bacterium]|nr:RNB domain-containing ribonuclease [Ignavibacteria bacterium]